TVPRVLLHQPYRLVRSEDDIALPRPASLFYSSKQSFGLLSCEWHDLFNASAGRLFQATSSSALGKPAKVALTACMRKLLVILNAMLRDRVAWQMHALQQDSCC